jgi:hypothetical protein
MKRQHIIAQVRAARTKLLSAIEGLTPDQMLRPGVAGLWSVKDILAHLTAWESELITALAKLDPKQPPHLIEIEDVDEWNAEQYSVNAPRPLDIVLEDFHGVHKHLVRMIEELDDKTLTDVRAFKWMEGEPLSYLVFDTASWHEEEHAETITAWRTTL